MYTLPAFLQGDFASGQRTIQPKTIRIGTFATGMTAASWSGRR